MSHRIIEFVSRADSVTGETSSSCAIKACQTCRITCWKSKANTDTSTKFLETPRCGSASARPTYNNTSEERCKIARENQRAKKKRAKTVSTTKHADRWKNLKGREKRGTNRGSQKQFKKKWTHQNRVEKYHCTNIQKRASVENNCNSALPLEMKQNKCLWMNRDLLLWDSNLQKWHAASKNVQPEYRKPKITQDKSTREGKNESQCTWSGKETQKKVVNQNQPTWNAPTSGNFGNGHRLQTPTRSAFGHRGRGSAPWKSALCPAAIGKIEIRIGVNHINVAFLRARRGCDHQSAIFILQDTISPIIRGSACKTKAINGNQRKRERKTRANWNRSVTLTEAKTLWNRGRNPSSWRS